MTGPVKLILVIICVIVAFGLGYYTAHHWEDL